MKFIGFEREQEAIAWAKHIIGVDAAPGLCRAMSAVDKNDEFALVVVFSNFTSRNVDMHTAAVSGAEWASPKAILTMFNAAFGYAFNHLGAQRVTGLVKAKNLTARKFDEHLGFQLEGIMRNVFVDDDLCIYGFLREDYMSHKWYRSDDK